jgi:ferrochelatase
MRRTCNLSDLVAKQLMPAEKVMRPGEGGLAVLLMAYGGPHKLDDVEPYLLDVRGGRPVSAELVHEIRERYRTIGGRSPLLELTRRQARALERRLAAGPRAARVYVGMRHWSPTLRDALGEMVRDGVEQAVAIAMAPQYSPMSVGAYLRKLDAARRETGLDIDWRIVESWCEDPLLAEAFAWKIRKSLDGLSRAEREGLVLVFTAHSLPERILAEGDPYPAEVRRTIDAVLERLPPVEWRQAWQSQGQTGEPWLGPEAGDVMRQLAREGHSSVLMAPIGFLCDHVEILYDIDVLYRKLASELGMSFQRTESLNDDPLLVEALAAIVERAAAVEANGAPTARLSATSA